MPDNFARVDGFCYQEPGKFNLPTEFAQRQPNEKLIYVSLGSWASVDIDLLQRVTNILGQTQHKYIISKGPRSDEFDLPPNCWGDVYLPQSQILPLVDAVITHGGNNTVTESFAHGKPMVVVFEQCQQY